MNSPSDKSKVRPHSADGIEEYDNPMPRWWLGLFYFTIVFSIAYLVAMHGFHFTSLDQELQEALAEKKQQAAVAAKEGQEGLSSFLHDPAQIKAGAELFHTNCVACHGQAGEGGIGPNLTDDYWIHGGSDEAIVKTIVDGVPAKGMPPWGPILGEQKVKQVAAFIISLRGSNPPNGKEPQGELYPRK